MSQIVFLLNGDPVCLTDPAPTTTLLDWLREQRGMTGTKEGCNEGDCGACTVMVTDATGARAVNACILFLPQLHGRAVRTVEGIAGPDGALHPVQQAMIDHARVAMRVLHAGLRRVDGDGASERAAGFQRPACGQPVPLHRIRADRARRRGGGGSARSRVDA